MVFDGSAQVGQLTRRAGTPTAVLAYGLQKTDEALGDMIKALKQRNLYESTLFIEPTTGSGPYACDCPTATVPS